MTRTRVMVWCALMSVALISAHVGLGQIGAAEHNVVLLWPGGAPGAVGNQDADRPSLTLYVLPPSQPARSAVVVCPGGGYAGLAMDYEGRQEAEWLNSLGVAAFILKYRLAPRYHHPAMMEDAQRALRYVRAHAQELGIAPDRIGVWGFSAGGHLASTAATHFDAGNPSATDTIERASSRPDFAILSYPVITCSEWFKHEGSCKNLLGHNPIKSWPSISPMKSRSPLKRRQLFFFTRMMTRLFRLKTAWRFTWPFEKRSWRRNSTFTSMGPTGWAWRRKIPSCHPGRNGWQIGFESAGYCRPERSPRRRRKLLDAFAA